MSAIEDFREETKNILKNIVKEPKHERGYFKSIIRSERAISFPENISSSYIRAIRILRFQAKNADKVISDDELENVFDDFLMNFKYEDEAKKLSEIDKHIVELFNKIKNMKLEKHIFIIPIMNLSLTQDLIIGNTSIVNLTEQTLVNLESKYSIKLHFCEEKLSNIVETIIEENKTSVYAITVIEASDDNMALELAIEKTEACLNILRLYNSTAPFIVRDEFRNEFIIGIVHSNVNKNSCGRILRSANLIANVPTINSEIIKRMKEGGLTIIDELLLKNDDNLTSLEKDLLSAILWFGNAVKEQQKNMKFIKSVIALETLLVPDGGRNKRDTISKRLSSILYAHDDDDKKREVFLNMRSLYEIRNSIIHSGEVYLYDEDIAQVISWAQAIIQILLKYSDKSDNIINLIQNQFPINESIYSAKHEKNSILIKAYTFLLQIFRWNK